MADAEKSLLFVIKANIEDYNQKIGKAERDFRRSFGNIQKELEKTSQQFMMLGGAITAVFVGATLKFADTADKLQEMFVRTGIGTEALQELGYAAKISGSSLEGMEKAVKRMQVAIAKGSGDAVKLAEALKKIEDPVERAEILAEADASAFGKLGISLAELQTLTPDEQLKRILTAIAAIPDPANRAAAAISIFGGAGTDLLPMLENGADGLQKMIDQAHELGLVFSEDTIKSAGELKDMFDSLGMQFLALLGHLAQTESFKNLIANFSDLLTKGMDWIDKHPALIEAFFKFGAVILAVGVALKGMAIAMAIVQALTGPGGIAKVLLGLAAAGGAMLLINKMTAIPAIEAPEIPAMASGGIFTRPTLAMVGEGGAEAVMPLSSMGSMGIGGGITNHYHFAGFIADDMALRGFARQLEKIQGEETRRSFNKPSKTETYGGSHL